jgi:hypothetical protein
MDQQPLLGGKDVLYAAFMYPDQDIDLPLSLAAIGTVGDVLSVCSKLVIGTLRCTEGSTSVRDLYLTEHMGASVGYLIALGMDERDFERWCMKKHARFETRDDVSLSIPQPDFIRFLNNAVWLGSFHRRIVPEKRTERNHVG